METQTLDPRRKRVLFRSRLRGMHENDFLIGRFAEHCLPTMSEDQLQRFEALLEVPDIDLFNWIMGREAPSPEHDTDILRLIREFNGTNQ